MNGLVKRYGEKTVLSGLTFTLAAGGSAALWGANGAGKSTTLRCLLGQTSFEGQVRVDGRDPRAAPRQVRRRVGYVPQEFAAYDLTVAECLRFFAALKGMGEGRCQEVLALVDLTGEQGKAVAALSGGMRQRLALALALLADPPVLLLDEPTASLDAASRGQFLALLTALRGRGKTLLFASHRPEEVLELAERVLVIEGGQVANDLTAAQFAEETGAWVRLRLRRERWPFAKAALLHAGLDPADFEVEGLSWRSPRSPQ
ncbi:MAG: ABC transporter ATP-binding protein [Bacillota bacterium]